MLNKISKQLQMLSHSPRYWGSVLFVGIALLAVALFYQHVLDERPCLLCIQIRLWVSLMIVVSGVGLLVNNKRVLNFISHFLMVMVAVGLVERSYQLLGAERGFIFGDCGFDLGLPTWFAIDAWLPSVYYVETSCGYTPEIIFGITMADSLIVFSIGLLLLSASILVASLFGNKHGY